MFKVSFKEENGYPYRLVEKAGKITTVMYRGIVKLPRLWWYMPIDIIEWMRNREAIEFEENIATNTLIIYAMGKTKCADGDVYDSLLGERIAEAKAKMVIYKFFADLCLRIFNHYNGILTGNDISYLPSTDKGVVGDIKKYRKLYQIEQEHINKLLGNGNE